jgi:Rieske Fe-S protein
MDPRDPRDNNPNDEQAPAGDGEPALDAEDTPPATETVEHYVGLHQHIERLRADKRAPAPPELNADEARAYQMAALFRAATPGADLPDSGFVAALRDRLMRPAAASAPAGDPVALRPKRVGRRGLLSGGLAAAAAAVGVAAGVALERGHETKPSATVETPLVPPGSGIWVSVAKADMIPLGGVMHFSTDYIVGFLRHTPTGFAALSGVCTHMSCLLQWNGGTRTYDCPCHGGQFTETGESAATSPIWYRSLPQIQTKIEDGHVWVYVVPPGVGSTNTPAAGSGGYGRPDPTNP